jgi:hypothetical protein
MCARQSIPATLRILPKNVFPWQPDGRLLLTTIKNNSTRVAHSSVSTIALPNSTYFCIQSTVVQNRGDLYCTISKSSIHSYSLASNILPYRTIALTESWQDITPPVSSLFSEKSTKIDSGPENKHITSPKLRCEQSSIPSVGIAEVVYDLHFPLQVSQWMTQRTGIFGGWVSNVPVCRVG